MRYHGHRLREGRYTEAGRPYLLTTVTQARQPLFRDPMSATEMARLIHHYSGEDWCYSWAWVVMPDHIHWLLSPAPGVTLSRLMRALKAFSARKLKPQAGSQSGPLWQSGYHDHALRREEDLREMARYVIANPVRAGLVSSIRYYPWWNAAWL